MDHPISRSADPASLSSEVVVSRIIASELPVIAARFFAFLHGDGTEKLLNERLRECGAAYATGGRYER